jgi:hypothetical protein
MRHVPVLLFIGALTGAALPATAAAQLAVDQLVVRVAPADGSTRIMIPVHNEGMEAVDVEIVVNDWQVHEAGRHSFHPAGTLEGSCGVRLRAGRDSIRIHAGATAEVQLTYDGAAADRCRNIVFFRVSDRPATLDGDRLVISTGVKLYVER